MPTAGFHHRSKPPLGARAHRGHPCARGLLAAWIAQAAGGLIGDFSGNGHLATLINGPTWESAPTGSVIHFNGTSSYAQNNDLVLPTTRATVALLVKPLSSSSQGSTFGNPGDQAAT